MPAYSFEALDHQGQSRRGVLEADTPRAARGLLRSQALVPLTVEPVIALEDDGTFSGRMLGGSRRRVFNATGLAIWTRQVAGLVGSGLPLERALSAIFVATPSYGTRASSVVRLTPQGGHFTEVRYGAQGRQGRSELAFGTAP